MDHFNEYGKVTDVKMNLDHRTGFMKGYAIITFKDYEDAKNAVDTANGSDLLGNIINCDFCYVQNK